MLKEKKDYKKNYDVIGYHGFSYFSGISVIDLDSDCVIWFYSTDSKKRIESVSDINFSEIHYHDNSLECTCEDQDNCSCDYSRTFFYMIDDNKFKESKKEKYTKIYLDEVMRVNL